MKIKEIQVMIDNWNKFTDYCANVLLISMEEYNKVFDKRPNDDKIGKRYKLPIDKDLKILGINDKNSHPIEDKVYLTDELNNSRYSFPLKWLLIKDKGQLRETISIYYTNEFGQTK